MDVYQVWFDGGLMVSQFETCVFGVLRLSFWFAVLVFKLTTGL